MVRRSVSWFPAAGFALIVANAGAQQIVHLPESGGGTNPQGPAQAFGDGIQERRIAVAEFAPQANTYTYGNNFGTLLRPGVFGVQRWIAPLGVPVGAFVEEILLLVEDEDADFDISGYLVFSAQAVDGEGECDTGFLEGAWSADSAGIDGRGIVSMQDDPPYLIRGRAVYPPGQCVSENYLLYSVAVDLSSTDHALAGAVVRWRRSVSPAPDSATFGDVPTDHPFFQFVEALAASGITAGCGTGIYCPDDPLTRGQMAVFLAKALGLHWPF
jgi:hypothetical protein